MFASGDAKFVAALHAIVVFSPRRFFIQLFQQSASQPELIFILQLRKNQTLIT